MAKTEKCYLLHIKLGDKPNAYRIQSAATRIKELVAELSPDHQLAYTSGDGGTFGFFLKSSLWAHQIASCIHTPNGPSPLLREDSLIVVEIGKDFSDWGRGKAGTWLKYHHPESNPASKSQVVSGEDKAKSQLASQLAAIKEKVEKQD